MQTNDAARKYPADATEGAPVPGTATGPAPAAAADAFHDHGLQIAVLDRGFVYVGQVYTNGEWCVIENAKNVRRWGTTKGLGELAAQGPQRNTVLDEAGTVKASIRSLNHLIGCEAEKWTA